MKKGSNATNRKRPNRLSETKRRDILGEIARREITVKKASEKYKIATSAIYRWQRQWGFKPPTNESAQAAVVTAKVSAAEPLDNSLVSAELRIRQLEFENKRLAVLVETLAEAISEYASNAD